MAGSTVVEAAGSAAGSAGSVGQAVESAACSAAGSVAVSVTAEMGMAAEGWVVEESAGFSAEPASTTRGGAFIIVCAQSNPESASARIVPAGATNVALLVSITMGSTNVAARVDKRRAARVEWGGGVQLTTMR
jgi:hypothetical protein